MSVLLALVDRNLPLHFCAKVKDGKIDNIPLPKGKGWTSQKKLKTMARLLVSGCSHPAVVEQLAKDWADLPSELKLEIREIANFGGWRSGNVTKGLARLHNGTDGDVFRRQIRAEERTFMERDGTSAVAYKKRRSEAVIGAERAFAPFALPPNYDQLSSTQKRKLQRQMAQERRELK